MDFQNPVLEAVMTDLAEDAGDCGLFNSALGKGLFNDAL